MADAMRQSGVSVEKSLEFMSPVYRMQIGLIGRILGQDPELYGDILTLNPYIREVLGQCGDSVQSLRGILESGTPDDFRRFFAENAKHFRNYVPQATIETDALIECMVGL
jgi:prephenate dehydrogenase